MERRAFGANISRSFRCLRQIWIPIFNWSNKTSGELSDSAIIIGCYSGQYCQEFLSFARLEVTKYLDQLLKNEKTLHNQSSTSYKSSLFKICCFRTICVICNLESTVRQLTHSRRCSVRPMRTSLNQSVHALIQSYSLIRCEGQSTCEEHFQIGISKIGGV